MVAINGDTPRRITLPDTSRLLDTAWRWAASIISALGIFAVFMWIKGANPLTAYNDMFHWMISGNAPAEVLIKASPLVLAGLAVAVPARAGMLNVGGEGQLVIGAVAAAGVARGLSELPGPLTMVLMGLAAAMAGAAWSGIAVLLRLKFKVAESVTTLLLNYVAIDVMAFLIYDKWKDRKGSGQPASPPLGLDEHLPHLTKSRVHLGLIIALVATFAVYLALRGTRWGFRLKVVGANPEAARRSGLNVAILMSSAMLLGGALAGIGGFVQLAGVEFKLRQGLLMSYGYIAFLASWLARHKPIGVAVAAAVLAAITIGGDSLQIDSQLPAASVNILLALVLLCVFGFKRKAAAQ